MKGRKSFSDSASNVDGGRDREKDEMRRELEELRSELERLEVESRSNHEVGEMRKRALDDALAKFQEKKQQVDQLTEELHRRADDIDDAKHKYDEIRATLLQKESVLRSLSSANEQLRSNFNEGQKKMENEKKELASALDDANIKCQEQEKNLKKCVSEIENLKSAIGFVQKKCSEAEAVAEEKTKAMRQLESELESKAATLAVFAKNKTHSDVLKIKLAECERSLAQENAQRVSAERALDELKRRDEHFLKVEQAHASVQEQLKWRKEQFGLLEEAYKKLQQQFEDGKKEWEGEKTGLIAEISALQGNLESQCRLSNDLQLQLQRCNQALAHEESRRKVLEIQAEESRHGFEKVAAECEEARSVIESLTEKSSKEVGSLRDSLALKERQMREMEVKQTHMEQENRELKSAVEEFEASRSCDYDMRSSLERFRGKSTALEKAYKECSETLKLKEDQWDREREEILKTLNDSQLNLVLKDERLNDMQSQLERTHSLVERLTDQKAELSQRLLILESEFEEVQSKLDAANLTLEMSNKKKCEEIACLKDQLEAKFKAFELVQLELAQHKETIETMSTKYESLEDLERQCSAMREDLERKQEQLQSLSKSRDHIQQQMLQKEQDFVEEVNKITVSLEEANAHLQEKEQKESELRKELCSLQVIVDSTKAAHTALEIHVEDYQHQIKVLQKEISSAKDALDVSGEKSEKDRDCLLDVIKVRDKKIEELKGEVVHLEQNLKALSQQEENWLEMQSQYKHVSDRRARELEFLSAVNSKLEVIAKQVLDKEQEIELLQKCLENKEADLAELRKLNEVLSAEKNAATDSIKTHQEKCSKLEEEIDTSKMAFKEACTKLEEVESEIAARNNDIAELRQKLKCIDVLRQELTDAKTKMHNLENSLVEATSSLQDEEEKLSASERAVEHLESEVSVVKLALAEKEKEAAILKGNLTDSMNKLKAKDDQLLEMDANLSGILRKIDEKQAEIETLSKAMREMEKRAGEWKEREAGIEAEFKSIGCVLEEKVAALNAAELEVRSKTDALVGVQNAVQQLKFQLAIREKHCFDKQAEAEHLYEELERAKISEHQSLECLKEAKGRLLQLEQGSEDQIRKLHQSMMELQHELSVTCIKLESSEIEHKSVHDELVSCNKKCASLEQLVNTKDIALKAKEADLSSLQADNLKQADVIEKGQKDLCLLQDRLECQLVREQCLEENLSSFRGQVAELEDRLQCQLVREQSLEKSLSSFRDQLAEMQACNECLNKELCAFHQSHDVTLDELVCKRNEVEELGKRLRQMEVIEGEANSSISLMKEQLALTLQSVNDQDICISGLREDLVVSPSQLEKFNDGAESSGQGVCEFLEKFRIFEAKVDILEKQVIILESALEGAEGSLKEEVDGALSIYHSFSQLTTLLLEFKVDAECCLKEGRTYATEINNALEVIDKLKFQVEMFEKRENDMISKLANLEELLEGSQSVSTMQAEQIVSLMNATKDLENRLLEWQNKAISSAKDVEYVGSELQNAHEIIRDLKEQLNEYKSIKHCLKENENSMISLASIDELKTQLENWKLMAMSASEEITMVKLHLKLSEENVREKNAQIEAHKDRECYMEREYFTLQEEISNGLSGIFDEMDKFLFVYSFIEKLEGEALKCGQETLLNYEQMRGTMSDFGGELNVLFESWQLQLQSHEARQQCMLEQLSKVRSDLQDAYSDLNNEREKVSHYIESMEMVQADLKLWKEKGSVANIQNKCLQTELELSNKALDVWRIRTEEGLDREKHLQDEVSALRDALQNLNHDFLEEKRRADCLLSAVKSMEEEQDSWQEKIRSATDQAEAAKVELEDTKKKLSELTAYAATKDEHLQNFLEQNRKLRNQLSNAQEEILAGNNFVQNILCQLDSLRVHEINFQACFQALQAKLLHKADIEGTLEVCPNQSIDYSKEEEIVWNASGDRNVTHMPCLSSIDIIRNRGRVGSMDDKLLKAVEIQNLGDDAVEAAIHLLPNNKDLSVLNLNLLSCDDGDRMQMYETWLKARGEQAEQNVQGLIKELEAALVALSGKNIAIENLNRHVENLQSMVERLEQRNSQLELYKNSNVIEHERYFHYSELYDSLIREQLRLKKKLEVSERKNKGLAQQIEEMQRSTQAGSSLEETKNEPSVEDRELNENLNENQDENLPVSCTAKVKTPMEFSSGPGSSDRPPLQVLNCQLPNPSQVQLQWKGQ